MHPISVFDMLKPGIGPSSSHTLGPWRAAQRFLQELQGKDLLEKIEKIDVALYGSLALTGKGHGTDKAILFGLSGEDPENILPDQVDAIPHKIKTEGEILLQGKKAIPFVPEENIHFLFSECLPFHANGISFKARFKVEPQYEVTYYSIGGGFVVKENEPHEGSTLKLPFPIEYGSELINYCRQKNWRISDIVYENEKSWRNEEDIDGKLWRIWEVMRDCVFKGCHTAGVLPGGLNVNRRAASISKKLLSSADYPSAAEWIRDIRNGHYSFSEIVKWVGCFAMAVNEENASFGRVVTAPTNGASGVIPAVLFYYFCFCGKELTKKDIIRFLLVAGEIGSIFKKGSTISAAMGGCQAEIGVSSAMAAAALTECQGGSPAQALMAAEIAMEHHLGMTCDPIGGLVQIPCIERNSMGAMKAITAANIALESDSAKAKVSLDDVIKTMWETAKDMNSKYKETSQGGLAAQISIVLPEC